MNLESQVCNLELSKRLKELGVKQESLFSWVNDRGKSAIWDETMWSEFETPNNPKFIASAFTVAELGEMLPKGYVTGYTVWDDENKKNACHWYRTDALGKATPANADRNPPVITETIYASTEANARAKMLIYLKEKK